MLGDSHYSEKSHNSEPTRYMLLRFVAGPRHDGGTAIPGATRPQPWSIVHRPHLTHLPFRGLLPTVHYHVHTATYYYMLLLYYSVLPSTDTYHDVLLLLLRTNGMLLTSTTLEHR